MSFSISKLVPKSISDGAKQVGNAIGLGDKATKTDAAKGAKELGTMDKIKNGAKKAAPIAALGVTGLAISKLAPSLRAKGGGDDAPVPTYDPKQGDKRVKALKDGNDSNLRKPGDKILDLVGKVPGWVPGSGTIKAATDNREAGVRAAVEGVRNGVSPLKIKSSGEDAQAKAVKLTQDAYKGRKTSDGTNGHGKRWDYDNEVDAMRHSTGVAAMKLRFMRDHGMSPGNAERAALSIGIGKEQQGTRDGSNTPTASKMDLHNNQVGARIIGDGKNADGSWMTDEQVLAAIQKEGAGKLVTIKDGKVVPVTAAGIDPSKGGG